MDADVTAPVTALLDQLERTVKDARSMPVSASCLVNRADVLRLVEDLRRALPQALDRAAEVLGDKEGVVAEGRSEAERLRDGADVRRLRAAAHLLAGEFAAAWAAYHVPASPPPPAPAGSPRRPPAP